jgi:two-component system, chemotaxis family, CheB/CheR fusion protein
MDWLVGTAVARVRHVTGKIAAPQKRSRVDEELELLLHLIKRKNGYDFRGYKRASLARRIDKRIASLGLRDRAEYREYANACPVERAKLVDALLINVTRFFRDEGSWAFLADRVVPEVLKRKGKGGEIRIWSAGCASGEEPYTLAMIFAEAMGDGEFARRVKIHATDIDEDALSRGAYALYRERELSVLRPELRRRYFVPAGKHFSFREDLRSRVSFTRHDLIADAPLEQVDLLSCRNTLMYLEAETQNGILERFHTALNDGGILFLGRAEALLTHATAFRPIDLKRRISYKVPRA